MKNSATLPITLSVLVFTFAASSFARAQTARPSLTLHGTVTRAQQNAYLEIPFTVPANIERITVNFSYTGKQDHATLDLGVRDPQRFRGWSGGNKSSFTIGIPDATPSYLPGPIPPGRWHLLIGVANLRPGKSATYTADIFFTRKGEAGGAESFTDHPLSTEARWYRGDLHMHTAHSDGSCPSQSGKPVPCPLFITLQKAVAQGLDFVAVTDHNTISHFDDEREMQPYFDKLLLIPGRELTTYSGHFNIFGTTDFIDFELGSPRAPDMNSIFRAAHRLGALASVNHPASPTGEICMGCGWSPKNFDMHLTDAIEAVNGDNADRGQNHTGYWRAQLNRGLRITAIGGSDTHRPVPRPGGISTIGHPATVVYATELSVPAILQAIREGHVFVDTTASHDRLLEVTGTVSNQTAHMGDLLTAPAGTTLDLAVHAAACAGSKVQFLLDGKSSDALPNQTITAADQTLHATWPSDGKHHWLETDVITPDGRLQLLGNPIYLNWNTAAPR
ncbi:CehA/McbA family metallohydrolase [Edaphobacter sp.]|uniref:CehA/McbA family metallohydrolase n=1 Tax=Edaphobacter sp. TaxID=1934404 RepID=UPI002DB6D094|nr:CehA/McbA family metallohydrolase [Edaphobacter sp.]HEU5341774.1 CehA/McbA family metallohydrolase [Edaphobacter sp.]